MRQSLAVSPWRGILLLGLSLALLPGMAASQGEARLEAEDFVAKDEHGAIPIQIKVCSGASQGLAVDGLDVAGEWIAWEISLVERYCFRDSLRSAGSVKAVRTFITQFERMPYEEIVDADTVVTLPGSGIG